MAKDMSPVFMIQAKQLFDSGKFSAAIMTLEEGLKQYPHFMSARVLLGEVHWTAGEVALARASLEYVINSVPDNFAAHRKLALIYREVGEVQLAMKSCRSVLQANPRDLEMRTLLDQLQELPAAASDPPQAERTSHTAPPPMPHDLPHAVPQPDHLVMASGTEPLVMASKEPETIDSETLAELYILQGYQDKGLLVYHRLAAKYPQNKQYQDRIQALERPTIRDATQPSESVSAALTLPQEALSTGGLPDGAGDTGQGSVSADPGRVGDTGKGSVSADQGRVGDMGKGSVSADPGRVGDMGEEVRLGGLPGGTGAMARRKNQVRRLEGWLQVVRARRRL